MALNPCYECEREISDKALSCPHCGAPRKEENAPFTPCYECEREISDEAAACPYCGAPRKQEELSGDLLERAKDRYWATYSELMDAIRVTANVDCFADAAWRMFGYPERPKSGSAFNFLRSKEKIDREDFLFREFYLSSVAVSCSVLVAPQDRDDRLLKFANLIITDLLRSYDPQLLAESWGLKNPREMKEYAARTFMFYLAPEGSYGLQYMCGCFSGRAKSILGRVPVEWKIAKVDGSETPTVQFFGVLFEKAENGPLVGKITRAERQADAEGLPQKFRLYR